MTPARPWNAVVQALEIWGPLFGCSTATVWLLFGQGLIAVRTRFDCHAKDTKLPFNGGSIEGQCVQHDVPSFDITHRESVSLCCTSEESEGAYQPQSSSSQLLSRLRDMVLLPWPSLRPALLCRPLAQIILVCCTRTVIMLGDNYFFFIVLILFNFCKLWNYWS